MARGWRSIGGKEKLAATADDDEGMNECCSRNVRRRRPKGREEKEPKTALPLQVAQVPMEEKGKTR